jgi:hypothetical protein
MQDKSFELFVRDGNNRDGMNGVQHISHGVLRIKRFTLKEIDDLQSASVREQSDHHLGNVDETTRDFRCVRVRGKPKFLMLVHVEKTALITGE